MICELMNKQTHQRSQKHDLLGEGNDDDNNYNDNGNKNHNNISNNDD